jgi:hypothetical protein
MLVVALAFIPQPLAQSANHPQSVSFSRNDSIDNDLYENGSLLADNSATRQTPLSAPPDDQRSWPQSMTDQNPVGGQSTPSPADATAEHPGNALSPAAGGTGTQSAQNANAHIKPLSNALVPGSSQVGSVGAAAGGTGSPGEKGISSPRAGGVSANSATVGHRAAPWQTSSWPQEQAIALQAVQQGSVPDQYRQLVRAYFERE